MQKLEHFPIKFSPREKLLRNYASTSSINTRSEFRSLQFYNLPIETSAHTWRTTSVYHLLTKLSDTPALPDRCEKFARRKCDAQNVRIRREDYGIVSAMHIPTCASCYERPVDGRFLSRPGESDELIGLNANGETLRRESNYRGCHYRHIHVCVHYIAEWFTA